MGCHDRLFASGLSEIQIKVLLVALYPLLNIADKYFFKKKFVGLA
jgi:hypothetical protein